ncbi:MAG: ATP synthase subunit I [Butyrivibrio sp.]|uniref:ATP synthase subunit I n=1 Tax=Butyrivibrio sp. FCS014 TaxID=1408304 RepID=UPI0004658929|nr:ATP synthase subunit I [Butyrivibrio sp. FCS014]MCR5156317.1 ATP synthase subunit I [Butyrivibrio sp.]
MKIQPAVKQETGRLAIGTGIGVLIMFAIFFILHMVIPKDAPFGWSVPFDYKVILGGIGGFIVAVGNFFWMAMTVQKVTSIEDDAQARSTMGVSLRYRYMLQILWVILAIVVPIFNLVAGIVPLFIPSLYIKLRGIISAGKGG